MARAVLIWACVALTVALPLAIAATSPLLEWRDPVYIAAGFAGVIGLALLFVQPLLARGALPGLQGRHGRHAHRWIGGAVVSAVVAHVAGLWLTSPPDVVDALTFTSPTPFSVWGVIAMWAVFATALIAGLRRRLQPRTWRLLHTALGLVIVAGTVAHAMLIEGTMGSYSKTALGVLALGTTLWAVDLRLLRRRAA